jgi:hypothetical protein
VANKLIMACYKQEQVPCHGKQQQHKPIPINKYTTCPFKYHFLIPTCKQRDSLALPITTDVVIYPMPPASETQGL